MALNSSHNISSISQGRFFLTSATAGTLGATALGGPRMAVPQDLDVDAFLKLSESLFGKEDLDLNIATGMLHALQTRGDSAEIATLFDGGTSPEIESAINKTMCPKHYQFSADALPAGELHNSRVPFNVGSAPVLKEHPKPAFVV